MPRTYKRTAPDRRLLTEEQLNTAKLLISKGLSIRCAASGIGLKESTLRNRLKIGKTAEKLGLGTTFSKVQEQDIFNYLKECESLFYGLTMNNLKKLIFEYAEVNKIRHRFNKSTKEAGREWVCGFFKRFPELKLHVKTPPSAARAVEINKTHVKAFHENLKCVYSKYNFAPSRIFNLGERDIVIESEGNSNIISLKANNPNDKATLAGRGQIITLVCTMSATGNFFPPAFIFPKTMRENLLKSFPKGSIAMLSDNGFRNSELFIEYLHHFKDYVEATKDNPVLLIIDPNTSYISLEPVNFCRDNGIHLITLPPYSGGAKQPLNRGIFRPLESKFLFECEKWLGEHAGHEIYMAEVANRVNETLKLVATKTNAIIGFNVTGIWPIDKDFEATPVAVSAPYSLNTELLDLEEVPATSSINDTNLITEGITSLDTPPSKDIDPLSYT